MLKNRYMDCFPDVSKTSLAVYWEEISKAYTQSGRHYHNLDHLAAMLENEQAYPGVIGDRNSLRLAIFYHDIVYAPLRKDNERKSAEFATARLSALNVAAREVQKVHEWILATAHHDAGEDADDDLKLLLDLDLGVLAADAPDYREYTRQVRREYRLVPGPLYRRGRRKVLASFLERPRIYHTDYFYNRWEPSARRNLAAELKDL